MLAVVVRLKKTAGNLEGLALGLPEYKSSEYKSTSFTQRLLIAKCEFMVRSTAKRGKIARSC